jgi:hypothetical protein
LGAEFGTVNGTQEMLLDDIVYAVDDYVPCGIFRKRSIGQKAISELRTDPQLASYKYHEEDI